MSEGVKQKPVDKLLFYGLLSSVLYYFLLTKQDLLTAYFTKGGYYAFLPILTAFLFSFIHGNFTDYFWKVLGIEPKKRREVK